MSSTYIQPIGSRQVAAVGGEAVSTITAWGLRMLGTPTTPLQAACASKYLTSTVQRILQHTDEDLTLPLCYAIAAPHVGNVKLLLQHGADPHAQTPGGITPLETAEHMLQERNTPAAENIMELLNNA